MPIEHLAKHILPTVQYFNQAPRTVPCRTGTVQYLSIVSRPSRLRSPRLEQPRTSSGSQRSSTEGYPIARMQNTLDSTVQYIQYSTYNLSVRDFRSQSSAVRFIREYRRSQKTIHYIHTVHIVHTVHTYCLPPVAVAAVTFRLFLTQNPNPMFLVSAFTVHTVHTQSTRCVAWQNVISHRCVRGALSDSIS